MLYYIFIYFYITIEQLWQLCNEKRKEIEKNEKLRKLLKLP